MKRSEDIRRFVVVARLCWWCRFRLWLYDAGIGGRLHVECLLRAGLPMKPLRTRRSDQWD